VLAAAIAGHADCIVTQNIKHFPKELLVPFGIASLHPDEFLHQQLHLAPFQVLPAFKAMRSRLRNPAFTPLLSPTAWSATGWSRPPASCVKLCS
jgi:hypothetical protein